jgi:DNA (cytosine-5)-methyltransferase 1
MAYANGWHAKEGGAERIQRGREHRLQPQGGRIGFVAHANEGEWRPGRAAPEEPELAGRGAADSMGDAQCARLEGHRPDQATFGRSGAAGPTATAGLLDPWSNVVWLQCSDGKLRPTGEVEPELQPVADRLSDSLGLVRAGEKWIISPLSCSSKNRVGRLRGYGNAIVPQVAAEFVAACVDVLSLSRLDRRDRIDHGGDGEKSDPNGRQNRAQCDEADEQDGSNRQCRDLGDDAQGYSDLGHASMSAFTSAARLS